ncbi:phage baseplate assembly protein V [Sedimenticola hydrogenitrophicus]|uniref:phage baseplate assembly protein V n=1 Tax=Sedimenticola hydrogenitrophicus TaxID=2967975 RepID=UPI0023AF93B2|nr:phage baseplate assembly protein V [Sedimenticola hydrogenitrophicus]
MDFTLVELARRIENLIRPGVVAEADYATARVRIKVGGLKTDWVPWLTSRAGGDRSWWAPEVGEQVLLLSPGGDPAQGYALPAIYRAAHPANASSPDIHRVDYGNGSWIEHDRASGKLSIHAAGDIDLVAGGNVRINGQRIDLN